MGSRIAEAFREIRVARSRTISDVTDQENLQFCRIARGSLCEIKDDLIASFDEGYISLEVFEQLLDLQGQTARSLNGYIRSTRRWMTNDESP